MLIIWNRFSIIFLLLIFSMFLHTEFIHSHNVRSNHFNVCFPGSAYVSFVSNAAEFPIEDYIVVGGGTASCPLATTRFRVPVLERGDIEFYNNSLIGFDDRRCDIEFYNNSLIGFDDRRLINASYEWVEVFRPVVREWQRSFLAGIGVYHCFELNHVLGTKIAGSVFDTEGVRHNEADLLSYADRKRIEVVLFASVERVLLARSVEGSVSAIGFVFRNVEGGYRHAMLKDGGEVLLGIPVGHHSPYVGQFMYENPRNEISIVLPVRFDHLLMQVVRITELGTYIRAGSYIVQFASPARPVFLRSPTVATLIEKVVCPVSFENLRLGSTEVRAYPVFQFNYFSDAGDLERCINRTRIKGCVLNSRAMYGFKIPQWFGMRDFRFVALLPNQWGDGLMREFCGRSVITKWHYHGGCLAGIVVNRDLKVIEVNAARIVDGTAFTVSPGTTPQATVLMMGSIWHEAAERMDEADELNVIC